MIFRRCYSNILRTSELWEYAMKHSEECSSIIDYIAHFECHRVSHVYVLASRSWLWSISPHRRWQAWSGLKSLQRWLDCKCPKGPTTLKYNVYFFFLCSKYCSYWLARRRIARTSQFPEHSFSLPRTSSKRRHSFNNTWRSSTNIARAIHRTWVCWLEAVKMESQRLKNWAYCISRLNHKRSHR